MTKNHGNR